jgi:hypothetical protein
MSKVPKFLLFSLDFVAKSCKRMIFLKFMICIQTWLCLPSNGCHFLHGWLPFWLRTKNLYKIPWVDSTYLDIVVGEFENLVWGWLNFFPQIAKYLLCNFLQMGVRYDMQARNTQIQHKEHVQNRMGKFYQPHLTLGRSDSWFQRFALITKKIVHNCPKKIVIQKAFFLW